MSLRDDTSGSGQAVPTDVPTGTLITLNQTQAIQGAQNRLPRTPGIDWRKLRKVHAGTRIRVRYGPTTVRTTDTSGICGVATSLVACTTAPAPQVDADSAATTAAGVAEGLRRAPQIITQNAPWSSPGFRARRTPQTGTVIITGFATTDTRVTQLKNSLYGGTAGNTFYPFITVVSYGSLNTPSVVLSFTVTDGAYTADEVVVASQDSLITWNEQWFVTKNGRVETGPFQLIGGRAPINVVAQRDDVISLQVVISGSELMVVPVQVTINGWSYPTPKKTDGTYDRVLRNSPLWPSDQGTLACCQ